MRGFLILVFFFGLAVLRFLLWSAPKWCLKQICKRLWGMLKKWLKTVMKYRQDLLPFILIVLVLLAFVVRALLFR